MAATADIGPLCRRVRVRLHAGAALLFQSEPVFRSRPGQSGPGLSGSRLAREHRRSYSDLQRSCSFHAWLSERFVVPRLYFLCLAIYALAMWGLFAWLTGSRPDSVAGLYFITLMVLLHSGLARFTSAQLFGKDYPWYFQTGIANQYILGFGLQPSVAGIFLLVSLVLFARRQIW